MSQWFEVNSPATVSSDSDIVRREPAANAHMLGVLAAQYARGQLKPVIDEIIPLSRLADAYHRLENRQILGKLVMVPDDLLAAD